MNTSIFYILTTVVAFAILSSVSGQSQQTTPDDVRFTATKSGGKLHDDFYKLIEAQAPVQMALNQALTWDIEAQYEHFQLLQYHINANDKYAQYCSELMKGAQDLLNETLDKIDIDDSVDICDYIKGLYDFEKEKPISPEMREVILRINEYRNEIVKRLEEEQAEAAAKPADVRQIDQPDAKDENQGDEESDDDDSDNESDIKK